MKPSGRRCSASACAASPGGCFRAWHARAARPTANPSKTTRRAPTAIFHSISIRKFAAPSPPPRRWRRRASTEPFTSGAAAPSRSRTRSRARADSACATSTAAIRASTLTFHRSAISRRFPEPPALNDRSTPPTPTTTSTSPMAMAAITASCISKPPSTPRKTRAGSSRSMSTTTCSPASAPRSSRRCAITSTPPGKHRSRRSPPPITPPWPTVSSRRRSWRSINRAG